MDRIKGQWIEVETEFLFEDQFNVSNPDLRVNAHEIDGINFGPEFANFEEFKTAVQKRYDKDWPVSKCKFCILTSYLEQGHIEEVHV